VRAVVVLLGEELADLLRGCCCCGRACDGGLDDGRQMQHFFALSAVNGGFLWCCNAHTEFAAPDSQKSLCCELAVLLEAQRYNAMQPTTPRAALDSGLSAFGSTWTSWAYSAVSDSPSSCISGRDSHDRLRIKLPRFRRFLRSISATA